MPRTIRRQTKSVSDMVLWVVETPLGMRTILMAHRIPALVSIAALAFTLSLSICAQSQFASGYEVDTARHDVCLSTPCRSDMKSVPPRGSGWAAAIADCQLSNADYAVTA